MVEEPTRSGLGFDELRKKFLAENYFKPQEFLARLEVPKPEEYLIPIVFESGTPPKKLRFRAWNHGELMALTKLPFYQKIVSKQELTDKENEVFTIAKEQMLDRVALDNNQWTNLVSNHPEIVGRVFGIVLTLSGIDEEFFKGLDEFLSSDIGFYYGIVWFQMMHKTPSEVSKVSESDYQAVTLWMTKWAERSKR